MLTHQSIITLTPALSLERRGRKTNLHSLFSTFVSNQQRPPCEAGAYSQAALLYPVAGSSVLLPFRVKSEITVKLNVIEPRIK